MDEQEQLKWESDALQALSAKYTPRQAEIVVQWMRGIKTSEENKLIGPRALECWIEFSYKLQKYGERADVYSTMMARAFLYAPTILKQHEQKQKQVQQ